MSTTTDMSGAGMMVPIDGIDFTFHPLSFRGHIELNEWVRAQAIKASVAAGVPLIDAIEAAASMAWLGKSGKQWLRGMEGTAHVFAISVSTPGWDEERMGTLLMKKPALAYDIWVGFMRVNGYMKTDEDVHGKVHDNGEPPDPTKLSASPA